MSASVSPPPSKRQHGQYFTTTNPFGLAPFQEWVGLIPNFKEQTLLEPFAGSGNIPKMMRELGYQNWWKCYDISPVPTSSCLVAARDTLASFPAGFEVAITNPPYLAKNSATRRGMDFPDTRYDDLYKVALDVMLRNTLYVAAIVPESFTTQGLFHSRLYSVVSLTRPMFLDTETPVCLALFVPEGVKESPLNFRMYAQNKLIGDFLSLKLHSAAPQGVGMPWKFNDSTGLIGLRAVDNQVSASIRFVPGNEIDENAVSGSSRSVTRVGCASLEPKDAERIVKAANQLLAERRERTQDTCLTAFKGLRKDGMFRRRLDYAQARDILNLASIAAGLNG